MAAADYRLCDICRAKTFYDSSLVYDLEENPDTGLYRLGAWACICVECAKTHEVVVRPRIGSAELAVASDAMRAAEVPDAVIDAITREP